MEWSRWKNLIRPSTLTRSRMIQSNVKFNVNKVWKPFVANESFFGTKMMRISKTLLLFWKSFILVPDCDQKSKNLLVLLRQIFHPLRCDIRNKWVSEWLSDMLELLFATKHPEGYFLFVLFLIVSWIGKLAWVLVAHGVRTDYHWDPGGRYQFTRSVHSPCLQDALIQIFKLVRGETGRLDWESPDRQFDVSVHSRPLWGEQSRLVCFWRVHFLKVKNQYWGNEWRIQFICSSLKPFHNCGMNSIFNGLLLLETKNQQVENIEE